MDRNYDAFGPDVIEAPEFTLRGRGSEREILDRFAASVWSGRGGALVVRGEAGAGKTALLDYLIRRASGCRVARTAGVRPEAECAFAGLHQPRAAFTDRLSRLPRPQRDALDTAFGVRDGAAPDHFMTGAAVQNLLLGVAAERPLICVVDDAQWLDRASARALGFAARRLADAPVGLVFAVRERAGGQELAGLPELAVRGLAEADARALLDSLIIGPFDRGVRDRMLVEAQGNPRRLVAMTSGLTPEEMAGGFGLPVPMSISDPAEESIRRQVDSLPAAARLLLLVASAEPAGDPVLVWRAADRLGLAAVTSAVQDISGLVEFGGHVRFLRWRARSVAYWTASAQDRQRVHRALAEVTGPQADAARRAWHLAHASLGPDEDLAAALEESAGDAKVRGGLAAAAAFRDHAARLTPPGTRRPQRALAAAEAKHQAGAPDSAMRLLAMAQAGPLDEQAGARAELLHALLAARSGPAAGVPRALLQVARRLELIQPGIARDAYHHAFRVTLDGGRLRSPSDVLEVATALPATPPEARFPADVADGLSVMVAGGYAAGVPVLRRALRAVARADDSGEGGSWQLALACRAARDIWDDGTWCTLSARLVARARQAGELSALSPALDSGMLCVLLAGDIEEAVSMAREAAAVARATGDPAGTYGLLALAAWSGWENEIVRLAADARPRMTARGEGQWLTAAGWAAAVLNNGLSRYDLAAEAAAGAAVPD